MGGHGAPPEAREDDGRGGPDEEEAREVAEGAEGAGRDVLAAAEGEGPVVDEPGDEGVAGRLILQRDVPRDLQGRVFAVKETAGSWGFGLAFVGGGALASALEPNQVFLIAGSGAIVVALATAMMLRRRRASREAVEAVG